MRRSLREIRQDSGMEADDATPNRPTTERIKAYLDEHIIGQEPGKKAISVAVYNHYKRINAEPADDDVRLFKGNILMVGPTDAANSRGPSSRQLLDVPFVVTDGTCLTEAVWVRRRALSSHCG